MDLGSYLHVIHRKDSFALYSKLSCDQHERPVDTLGRTRLSEESGTRELVKSVSVTAGIRRHSG